METRPALFSSSLVCALNLDSYSLMRERGIECVGGWDYLTRQDMIDVVENATRLSKQWREPFRRTLNPSSVDIFETGRVETLDLFREGLYASRVVHQILAEERPEIISLPETGNHPAIAQSSHSIFEGVAHYLLPQHRIQIDSIPPPPIQNLGRQNTKQKILPFVPSAVLREYRTLRKNFEERGRVRRGIRLLSLQDLEAIAFDSSKQPRIIVVGAYQDFLMLIDLADKLEREKGYRTLRIHMPNGAYDFAEILRTETTYKDMVHVLPLVANGLEYLSFEGLPEFQSAYRRHQPFMDEPSFQELKRASANLCPEIFANPYLDYQFDYYVSEFWPRVAASVDTTRDLLARVKPDLVIGTNGSANDRAFLMTAQAEGIRTLLLISGYPGDLEGLTYPTDYIAAQGENLKRRLLRLDKPEKQIATTGHIKFDRSITANKVNQMQSASMRHRLALDGRKVILFLTTDIGYAHFPGMNLSLHYRTLNIIFETARKMPDVYFLFKPHPRFDQISIYRRLIRKHEATNVRIVENVNIDELVPLADFAVLVNGATTAMFHVLLQKKPVVFIMTTGGAFPEFEVSFLECGGTLNVTDVREVEPMLARMLQDKQAQDFWVQRGHMLFQDCMYHPDGAASLRVVEFAQKIVENNG